MLVISAPDERELSALLDRIDVMLFRSGVVNDDSFQPTALPLEGRKLHVHTDWGREGG